MQFAVYTGERTVSELVGRLYTIEGPGSKEAAKQAEAALLDANPELAALNELPEGAPLEVPDVEGARPSAETSSVEQAASGIVGSDLRQALEAAVEALALAIAQRTEEANATLDLVKSADLKALAKDVPEIAAKLPTISAEAAARIKEAQALQAQQEKVAKDMRADLDEFLALLR